MTNNTDLRLQLLEAGYHPLPLFGKAPPMTGWQKRTNTNAAEIAMWAKAWPDARNTGILTRFTPTLDIDIAHVDAAKAVADLAAERFDSRGYVLTRTGKPPKCAIPFRTDAPFQKLDIALFGPDGARHKIEFLCDGQQVVVAGDHPDTRRPYSWHGGTLGEVKHGDLPAITAEEARQLVDDAVDLLIRDFGFTRANGKGAISGKVRERNSLGLETGKVVDGRDRQMIDILCAKLIDYCGQFGTAPTPEELCAHAWDAYAEDTDLTRPGRGRDEFLQKCRSTVRRFLEGRIKGLETLEEAVAAYDLDRGAQEGAKAHGSSDGAADDATGFEAKASRRKESNHSWDEPDISLLDDRRGDDLPEFPLAALCSHDLQDWVKRAAHGSGTSIEHVVVPLLGIASGVIGTARRIQASRSWAEPMVSWTALNAYSGEGKTPGINATKRPLALLEKNNKPKNAELKRKHEARAEAAKAAYAEWKEELKTARENGDPLPDKPPEADEVGNFVEPKLFVSNTTIERLGMLLQARPQGMLVLADELSAIFLNMSRYTSGQDNEFWLEAWNGGYYAIERVGRPPISLDYLMIGLVGGLQPDKLIECFDGAQDGMYARMLFAWPGKRPFRPLTDMVSEVEPEIVNALDRLNNLGGGDPDNLVVRSIPITAEARTVLEGLRKHVDTKIDLLEGRERDWWAKLPAHALRLTGTLCLLNWAWCGGPEPTEIGADYMRAGVQLGLEYFWPHARACLRLVGISEQHSNARRVLRWIKATGGDEVSREVIRRDALGRTLNADETQSLLDHLEQAGWLRKSTVKPTGAGRPAHRWHVNPRLAG